MATRGRAPELTIHPFAAFFILSFPLNSTTCSICLTKLDILDTFEEVKIAVGYKVDGVPILSMPGMFNTTIIRIRDFHCPIHLQHSILIMQSTTTQLISSHWRRYRLTTSLFPAGSQPRHMSSISMTSRATQRCTSGSSRS